MSVVVHVAYGYNADCSDWQLLLRVVRCLPSSTGLPGCGRTLRAGVGQASREETADILRHVRIGDGLWGFEWWVCLKSGQQAIGWAVT